MKTKAQAEKAGRALLRRMRGKKWKLRIWENIGWHYAVETRHLEVYPSWVTGGFFCLGKPHDGLFGEAGRSDSDPNRAVQQTLKNAGVILREYLNRFRSARDF